MTNRLNWMRIGIITLFGASVLSMPSVAAARDRCGNTNYSNRGNYSGYRNTEYRGGGDRNYAARDYGYRDYGYRNSGYSNSGYRDYGYRDNRYSNNGYGNDGYYGPTRSTGKSAAIIGGSAAAGAVIGGLTGGGKGAAIGAAVGGVGGLIYDRSTRNGDRAWPW